MRDIKRNNGNIIVGWWLGGVYSIRQVEARRGETERERLVGDEMKCLALQV
jgi:hypothetical protein